jgi:hypothetical protein
MNNPFAQAMDNTMKRAGVEQDMELVTYGKLQDTHFRALTRRFGFDNVQRYIRVMEAKRAGIPRLLGRK